jgi:hypothetical protein
MAVAGAMTLGCSLSHWAASPLVQPARPEETVLPASPPDGGPQPSEVPPPTPLPTRPAGYEACVWNWASQDLPEIAQGLSAALAAEGLVESEVNVSAFGENCYDDQGEIQYFAAMQTEYTITVVVREIDLGDRAQVGDLARQVLAVLVTEYPVDQTPGPNPGRISLALSDGAETTRINLSQDRAVSVVESGEVGAAFLAALES